MRLTYAHSRCLLFAALPALLLQGCYISGSGWTFRSGIDLRTCYKPAIFTELVDSRWDEWNRIAQKNAENAAPEVYYTSPPASGPMAWPSETEQPGVPPPAPATPLPAPSDGQSARLPAGSSSQFASPYSPNAEPAPIPGVPEALLPEQLPSAPLPPEPQRNDGPTADKSVPFTLIEPPDREVPTSSASRQEWQGVPPMTAPGAARPVTTPTARSTWLFSRP